MNLVDRIKETAKAQGMTLIELSKAAELGPKTISNWRSHNPQSQSLQKVADILNVSVDFLISGSATPENKQQRLLKPEEVSLQNKIEVANLSQAELEKLDSYLDFLKAEHARIVNEDL